MRNWLPVIITVIVIGVGVGGGCGWSGMSVINKILNNQFTITKLDFKVFKWCTNGLPFTDRLGELVRNKTYLVLLHNNRELRPTGGFMGSYVRLKFGERGLMEMKVMDIYQPDGQLMGHVEPPYAIQEAFGQGWWKLRDANWDVDTASAAATIAWFMWQGGEQKVDGMIGVNLDFLEKWITAIGPVNVVTYDQKVDENNLYSLAQENAEMNFVPGSTNKRDFLGAVGISLWEKTKNAGIVKWLKLAETVRKELKSGQIWLWFSDPDLQKLVEEKRWAGKLEKGDGDYMYIVESNLGSNKANCCITRSVTQEISNSNSNKVTIGWKNTGKYENPKPPEFWGGNYVDYVRVVIPKESVIVTVTVGDKILRKAAEKDFSIPSSLRQGRSGDMYNVQERDNFKILGFWAEVKAGGETKAEINYNSVLRQAQDKFTLRVNRQPGIENFPYKLIKDGEVIFEGNIDHERDFGL